MSLNREAAEEICKHIKENASALFGQKFWECRHTSTIQIQQKADKWETRFLAISKFRVFILHGKNATHLRLEKCFNILALRYLELMQQDQMLQIGWEDKSGGRQTSPPTVLHSLIRLPENSEHSAHELALELLATLKHYFPEVQKSLPKLFLNITPSLLAEFHALPTSIPELPCHNFRRSYVAYCDWMEQPFRDEVIWDIERIYFVHGQHELDLNDFSHLTLKDQQALIGSITFSDFFTGFIADGMRIAAEHVDALLALLRRSHSLKSLQLTRCVLPKEFLGQLAATLVLNCGLPLEKLKLAGTLLDDKKGLAQLATLLPQTAQFQHLVVPDCGLSDKAGLVLLHSLHHGINSAAGESTEVANNAAGQHRFRMQTLNLSGNPLGGSAEMSEQLSNLVALSNGLRFLDLSGTALQLDRLWAALKLGGLELEVLRLNGCHSSGSSGKRNSSGSAREKDVPQTVAKLFSGVRELREFSLAGTHIGTELLQAILMGLSANSLLPHSSLSICLDSAIVGPSAPASISAFEQHLPSCACIGSLSIRDCALELEAFRLFSALGRCAHIRTLDVGGANFASLRANKKHAPLLSGILTELVKLINGGTEQQQGAGGGGVEELSLADARLGSHLGVFLNALGLCGGLRKLDLSNNELGVGGARLLGKALQLNHSLQWLGLDRNQIGPDGFAEIARALRHNKCLKALQLPLNDLTESMLTFARSPVERARFQLVSEEIELALERNRRLTANGACSAAQLAQQTIYELSNGCERYNVNGSGPGAELSKVAFHKVSKLVAEMSEVEASSEQEDRASELADQVAERIERFAQANDERFSHKFTQRLAEQEGVEMHDCEEEENAQNEMDPDRRRLGDKLRANLTSVISGHLSESAWQRLFNRLDSGLSHSAPDQAFRLKEQRPESDTGAKKKAQIQIRASGGNAAPLSILKHRPVSAMMATEEHSNKQLQHNGHHTPAMNALAAALMSRSVMGDFSQSTAGDGGTKESTPAADGEDGSKLVHLAKQRPRPARQNRGRAVPKAIEEEELEQAKGSSNPTSAPEASVAEDQRCSVESGNASSSSGLATSLEQSLGSSPLMHLQRRKYLVGSEAADDGENNNDSERPSLASLDAALPSTPPPLLPRREKSVSGSSSTAAAPPKLPPKPSPPKEDARKKTNKVAAME